jgi:hypothetical protein
MTKWAFKKPVFYPVFLYGRYRKVRHPGGTSLRSCARPVLTRRLPVRPAPQAKA